MEHLNSDQEQVQPTKGRYLSPQHDLQKPSHRPEIKKNRQPSDIPQIQGMRPGSKNFSNRLQTLEQNNQNQEENKFKIKPGSPIHRLGSPGNMLKFSHINNSALIDEPAKKPRLNSPGTKLPHLNHQAPKIPLEKPPLQVGKKPGATNISKLAQFKEKNFFVMDSDAKSQMSDDKKEKKLSDDLDITTTQNSSSKEQSQNSNQKDLKGSVSPPKNLNEGREQQNIKIQKRKQIRSPQKFTPTNQIQETKDESPSENMIVKDISDDNNKIEKNEKKIFIIKHKKDNNNNVNSGSLELKTKQDQQNNQKFSNSNPNNVQEMEFKNLKNQKKFDSNPEIRKLLQKTNENESTKDSKNFSNSNEYQNNQNMIDVAKKNTRISKSNEHYQEENGPIMSNNSGIRGVNINVKKLLNNKDRESKVERKIIAKNLFQGLDDKKLFDQNRNKQIKKQQFQSDQKNDQNQESDDDLAMMIQELKEIANDDNIPQQKPKNEEIKKNDIIINSSCDDIEEREDLSQDVSQINIDTYNQQHNQVQWTQPQWTQPSEPSKTGNLNQYNLFQTDNKPEIVQDLQEKLGQEKFNQALQMAQSLVDKNNQQLMHYCKDMFGQIDTQQMEKYLAAIVGMALQNQEKHQ